MTTPHLTIYADPPWPERGGGKICRGAQHHYELLSVADIAALPVHLVGGANCHLYLWVTNNYLPEGLRVLSSWGFRYVTCVTWMKDRIGLGQYFRGITEHCLFGVRGVLPYRTNNASKRAQGVTGFLSPRREHSQKPDDLRRMIELVSHPPYLELFSRERERAGWDMVGHFVDGKDIRVRLIEMLVEVGQ